MKISLKLFILFFLSLSPLCRALAATQGKGFEVGAGPAAIEEGDDRFRPGAFFHVGIGPDYYGRLYSYGRKFGPIKETTHILTLNRRVPMFDSSWLMASFGLVLMNERTDVSTGDPAIDVSHNSTNLGASAGLHMRLDKVAPIYCEFGWDSHLFLAGPNGGLLLATGRKQAISLGLGIRL